MIQKAKNKIAHHLNELLKAHKSPDAIAWGISIGTFFSILIPINWINLLIGLVIILFFENISKIALFLTLIFWNPFTLIPIYFASFKLGSLILGDIGDFHFSYLLKFWNPANFSSFVEFLSRFLLGNLIIGAATSIILFFVTRKLAQQYQKRKNK